MRRILIAGIGNIFLGDDAFGVETARRLASRALPEGTTVRDFGIRGFDLIYALMEPNDAVILIDAVSRGEAPGTLYVIKPDIDRAAEPTLEGHLLDPVKVLALARSMGAEAAPTYIVGCEPARFGGADDDIAFGLSEPVNASLDDAVEMVESLLIQISEVLREQETEDNYDSNSSNSCVDGGRDPGAYRTARDTALPENEGDVAGLQSASFPHQQ